MLPWSLRVAVSLLLLRASRLLAALMRMLPRWVPRLSPPSLPGSDPVRAEEVRLQAEALRLIPIAEKYGFTDTFEHSTLAELPVEQRYPLRMNAPKALLAIALSIDVQRGAPARRPRVGRWLGVPAAVRWGWEAAPAFGPLRTQGPNPAWLQRVTDDGHPVSLAKLAAERVSPGGAGRLYAVDYRSLLRGVPVRSGRFLAPAAAFFVDDGGLQPVGIEVETPTGSHWISADGSERWDRARRSFHCAELHVHEAVSHFLWTHVYGEKLILATLRRLDRRHPIRRLLAPHLVGTLQANENSGGRLLGEGGLFAHCFSAGWTGVAELLRRGDRLWRFEQMLLPEELAARGVMELATYPYRDDGLLLWEALSRYVRGVVAAWFADDAAIVSDPELAEWSVELHGWLGDRGFPEVRTVAALVDVLTATLFGVVQHTLVNALQYDAFGDPSRWPASLSIPFQVGEGEGDVAPSGGDGLPVGAEALDATRATYGFSIQYNVLGDDLLAWHCSRTVTVARAFLAELKRIGQVIASGEAPRPWPYRIGHPSRVSNSINA